MSRWYVKNASGTHGPLSDVELADGLRANRFTWIDLVYGGGENRWRLLIEVEALRELRYPQVNPDSTLWVVYQGDRRVTHAGPFDTQIVIERIKAGEISYSDSICEMGRGTWRRVGDCEEFAPSLSHSISSSGGEVKDVVDELPQVSIDPAELLASVSRAESRPVFKHAVIDEPPPEADGDDLVGTPEWMKFIGGALFVLFSFGAFICGFPDANAADVLKIVPLKLQSAAPSLVFETNATKADVIEVKLIGESGEVLNVPSYRYQTRIRREPGELPTLNLGSLKLPKGAYRVEANIGDLKAKETIFVGLRDEEYAEALERHQKSIAAVTQDEKRTLFYSAQAHEKLATELISTFGLLKSQKKKWSRYYEKWNRELSKARERVLKLAERARARNSVAYPELIQDLSVASERLKQHGQELNAVIRGSREPASVKPRSFSGDFSSLKAQAGRL